MEGTVGNSAVFGTFPEWAVESPVVLLHEAEARVPHALHASRRKDVRRRKLRCGLGTRCAVSIRCTVLDLAKRLPVCRYVGASTASTSNIHGTVERHRAVPDVLPWQGLTEYSANTRTV